MYKIDAGMDREELRNYLKIWFISMPMLIMIILFWNNNGERVFDIIEEEATEDILKPAGADVQLDVENNQRYRAYGGFHGFNALMGQIFSKNLSGFSETLEALIALSFFISVDMGGNVGTQSSAIIVRAGNRQYRHPKECTG